MPPLFLSRNIEGGHAARAGLAGLPGSHTTPAAEREWLEAQREGLHQQVRD
eukprot:COSAG01_NODE_2139_length_8323_cov_13.355788_3_plen_51_part_00